MLPQHRQLANLGGRTRGAVASFFRMSSYVLKKESAKKENGAISKMDMPCQTMRQDRTWKSMQDVFFAEGKVKAWSPSNGIRFSDGPSPPFASRAAARKLSTSTRIRAANESREDIMNTTRQCEPSLGRDSTAVEVTGTKKADPEEPHEGILDSRLAVAGPSHDLGHQSAEQPLRIPLNAMVWSCTSKRTTITMRPDSGLPDAANLSAVSLDWRVKTPVRSDQTIEFADEPNPSMVDQADLSQMSEVCTERQKPVDNRVHQTERVSAASLAISAFDSRNIVFAQYSEEAVVQGSPIDIRKDMLRMLHEHNPAEAESTATIAETDSVRCIIPSWEDRVDEPSCGGKNGLLSLGSLGLQSSAPLMCPELSASKCLSESEPLYPVVDRAQFVSRYIDYGTSESSGSAMEHNAESPTPLEDTPFSTPLGYHIPKAKLQQAIDAAPSVMAAYWQYTLYRGPGGERDKVKVHYCKSKDSTERISQLFLDKEVIGFDIEWMMNATATDGVKKNVALIQIASEERIALFHIARYANATDVDDFVAPTLKRIMESSDITKVGVSVKGDCTRLRKYLNVEARGIFELSHLYKLVKYSCGDVKKINKVLVSLAQQVKEHLQLPLWKGEVRSSDWSQDLNYQQIQYAASDSYAGFQLFHILEAKRKALDPMPPRPAHAELDLPIRLANGRTVASYTNEMSESVEDANLDTGPDTPISIEELARDFLNLEIEEPSQEELPGDPPVPKAAKGTTNDAPSSKPLHPSVILANTWLTTYTTHLSPSRPVLARPSDLRAYHLWYHQDLSIQEIASRLRDPPLATSTVAGYVLRAVQVEKLPFHRKKVWGLVSEVHRSLRGGYKAMIGMRVREEEGEEG